MEYMFKNCADFNQPINHVQDTDKWSTSNVTTMAGMFEGCTNFDQDISKWNTSLVKDISNMFKNATSFNNPLNYDNAFNSWNTQQVENMSGIFQNAEAFDQEIGKWNTSKVVNMTNMFNNAQNFNRGIEDWNTSSVINMSGIFKDAKSFNQDITKWDTSTLADMSYMFHGASSFNSDISVWNTQSATTMEGMFGNCSWNYDLVKSPETLIPIEYYISQNDVVHETNIYSNYVTMLSTELLIGVQKGNIIDNSVTKVNEITDSEQSFSHYNVRSEWMKNRLQYDFGSFPYPQNRRIVAMFNAYVVKDNPSNYDTDHSKVATRRRSYNMRYVSNYHTDNINHYTEKSVLIDGVSYNFELDIRLEHKSRNVVYVKFVKVDNNGNISGPKYLRRGVTNYSTETATTAVNNDAQEYVES